PARHPPAGGVHARRLRRRQPARAHDQRVLLRVPATRRAIESAPNVRDANTYLLASPEFMRR
ncbi:hypothetical protein CKW47_20385, partial [Bordetella pertussis]